MGRGKKCKIREVRFLQVSSQALNNNNWLYQRWVHP